MLHFDQDNFFFPFISKKISSCDRRYYKKIKPMMPKNKILQFFFFSPFFLSFVKPNLKKNSSLTITSTKRDSLDKIDTSLKGAITIIFGFVEFCILCSISHLCFDCFRSHILLGWEFQELGLEIIYNKLNEFFIYIFFNMKHLQT